MIKKLILYVLVLATLVLFAGCSTSNENTIEESKSNYYFEDYRDPETGVHYLIYGSGYKGGLSVRYNADGTIMVD